MSVPVISVALEPLALSPANAARFLSISKRSLSRLIAAQKIEARKDGPRTLVDVASLKAYYASLPKKTDHAPIVFGRRAHVLPWRAAGGPSAYSSKGDPGAVRR